MNIISLLVATLAAKFAAGLLKLSRQGAGTSLPGKVARQVYPQVLTHLSQQVTGYRLGVTGTNGKTTTCGLLAQCLREAGHQVVHNQLGANMVPGITSALIEQTDALGRLKADVAVLEVDEASLRRLTAELNLDMILVTNLFRDQLDRYGELDITAKLILEGAGAATPLILNADDPLVAAMAQGRPTGSIWCFGVNQVFFEPSPPPLFTLVGFAREVTQCPVCGGLLAYTHTLYGHLGHYRCASCGFNRPQPMVWAETVTLTPEGSRVILQWQIGGAQQSVDLWLPLPGLFNVYNLLSAATAALLCGATPSILQAAIDHLPRVFGRAERRCVSGKDVLVMLIKNPVGATEVLRCVAGDAKGRLLIALNDNDADGRDVSWIWDATFELVPFDKPVVISGIRAWDMALRLKYAGVPEELITVKPDLASAIRLALSQTHASETLYLLPTYTALLELRTLWEKL